MTNDEEEASPPSDFVIPSSFVIRAFVILPNAHPKLRDESLRKPIDPKRDRKQHQPHHEERAIMGAAADHFAHLLRDDARHRVNGLKDCAETLGEIGNSDPVSST